MKPSISISVIVSTFNRPKSLDLVLKALLSQTDCDFQIVIADDGSGDATRNLITEYQREIAIIHVWHPHQGFRLARIRNKAVQESTGEYLLFLDGDCIPSPDWVERNRQLAEHGWLVQGQRIQSSSCYAGSIVQERRFSFPKLLDVRTFQLWSIGAINRISPLFRLPCERLRKWRFDDWKHVRGCNLGIWREDFFSVRGFDASFEGWGREDSDICVRLLNAGIKIKYGYFGSVVLHLWHESNLQTSGDRIELVRDRRAKRVVYPTLGISES